MRGKIKKMIEKKLEKDNVTIDPNVLHAKKEKIYPACLSKNYSNSAGKGYSFNDFKRRKTMALSCHIKAYQNY